MLYYPVIIPTLNRYEHFKECVESLAACTHANLTELVIGLDYPPEEKYISGWQKIKDYIPTITGFKKVTVFEANHNLGASENSSVLINSVIKNNKAYIYSEDDNVFSPCFLDFMNKALDYYMNDKKVLAVSGYMIPSKWSFDFDATVSHFYDFTAWGIGVFSEKWLKIDETMPPHYMKYVCSNRELLKRLKNYPRDLYQLVF